MGNLSLVSDRMVFGCTVLAGTVKTGHLPRDKNGYYDQPLGALGVMNSAGEFYLDTPAARATFLNGDLKRRLDEGLLKAEWGHPKPDGYRNRLEWERRSRSIDPDRECAHISDIYLEPVTYRGKTITCIVGKIRPTGPFGQHLEDKLNNPKENVTFSGRYYSNLGRLPTGVITREIHTVGTWDYVSEPGVAPSQKFVSPSLESHDPVIEVGGLILDRNMVESMIEQEEAMSLEGFSMESSSGISAKALLAKMSTKVSQNNLYRNW